MLNLPPILPRIIPCLLLSGDAFIKTRKFSKPMYIGDPINTINLFNRFEVDEIVVLDIDCPRSNSKPNFALIEELASECWVPLSYGGGISSVADARRILNSGIEKIIIDRMLFSNPNEVRNCVSEFGASSVVACINIRKSMLGSYAIYTNGGRDKVKMTLHDVITYLKNLGVGELLVNDINRDGMMHGYDLNLIRFFSSLIDIPLVIVGGASSAIDFKMAIDAGASAVASGAYFVYQSRNTESVLINYPDRKELERIFYE